MVNDDVIAKIESVENYFKGKADKDIDKILKTTIVLELCRISDNLKDISSELKRRNINGKQGKTKQKSTI